MCLSLLI
jgi:hypothetical protein